MWEYIYIYIYIYMYIRNEVTPNTYKTYLFENYDRSDEPLSQQQNLYLFGLKNMSNTAV